jgi:LL-diaminopimelate aminotransferase
MALINENFLRLSESYLFTEIARKVNAYKEEHPKADVISLGIGDVTQPLAPAVIEALHKATAEMAGAATFRGYGPERGYDFVREAIVENDFRARDIDIEADEVFVSDGAKSDTGNFQELLSRECVGAVTDPI